MAIPTLLAQILLRHRAAGHLRFQLPAPLCQQEFACYLEQGLHQLEGVRRVVVYADKAKLSIFYLETVCDERQVLRKLAQLIELLEQRRLAVAADAAPASLAQRLTIRLKAGILQPIQRAKQRINGWRRQVRMAKTLVNAQWQVNPALRLLGDNPEKAALGFINDLVTFYLIKVHWDLIMGKWLKSPLRHRYEWLTVFYFVFLLVRSRKG